MQEGQGSQPQSSASETGRKCSLAQGLSHPVVQQSVPPLDEAITRHILEKQFHFVGFFNYYYFKLNRLQYYYQALQKCAAHTGAI